MDRVEPVENVDRIVRRKEQIAVALRHIENEKQAVGEKCSPWIETRGLADLCYSGI